MQGQCVRPQMVHQHGASGGKTSGDHLHRLQRCVWHREPALPRQRSRGSRCYCESEAHCAGYHHSGHRRDEHRKECLENVLHFEYLAANCSATVMMRRMCVSAWTLRGLHSAHWAIYGPTTAVGTGHPCAPHWRIAARPGPSPVKYESTVVRF